jgi:diaminopimelate epimerase
MNLKFTKMYGLGNDFVLINCIDQDLGKWATKAGELSRRLCHRHFGIGADQVLLLYPSEIADFRMMIFNSDGSEVEMCGNGIRCFAKYIWDRGLLEKEVLSVETGAGIIRPEKAGDMVRVDMGEPVLDGRMIPVNLDGMIKDYPLKVDDREFKFTAVSMGNPHAVIFVEDVYSVDVKAYGPLIERHELFPKRVNAEFIQVLDSETIRMRVWERGAGETMACGTGASAAAVASHIHGFTGRLVHVHLAGGELLIEWKDNNHVYMTGPAVEAFEGTVGINGD